MASLGRKNTGAYAEVTALTQELATPYNRINIMRVRNA